MHAIVIRILIEEIYAIVPIDLYW